MMDRGTRVVQPPIHTEGNQHFLRLTSVALLWIWMTGCGGDSSSGPEPVDNTVAAVTVSPPSTNLQSLGATAQLTASARNSSGTTVSGTSFSWSTSNPSVASVSGAGLVTAVGNGAATITALAGGTSVSGTAQVTVQQAVAAVVVTPQNGSVRIGETLQLTAAATDGQGAPVPAASFTWSSSDPTTASVSSSGLVTGVSDGAVTITASSGSANGQAPVSVLRQNLAITQDTNLSGDVEVDEFTLAAGVTVTATGDLTIDATGGVEIAGTLVGDCVVMVIRGDTAVTVNGTVNNGCQAQGAAASLSIAANGELTLEDALVISSGDIDFTNDPSLTDDDFPETAPAGVGGAGSKVEGPQRAGSGVPFTRVNRTTVRYSGGGAGPDPAEPGTDGVDGTPGSNGRNVKMRLRGNAEFAGNTLLWGQDGGRGGHGTDAQANDVTATGAKGGDGGKISVFITGTLSYQGGENIVRSGSGGWGGDATATALPNDAGNKAPSATATAGPGGMPGLIDIRAGGGINVALPGALVLEVGIPGEGGVAKATGAKGRDALGATLPAQEGGDASATSGTGGSTPDKQLIKQGSVTGSPPVLRGATGLPLDGGVGGDSEATAGNGGNGIQASKRGGNGGNVTSFGGGGGDALIRGLDGTLVGDGGDGGMAVFAGGNGGDGWSDCLPGQPVEAGGDGGNGGSTSGDQGPGGQGLAPGDGGGTFFEVVGNGGDGGNGEPAGSGGLKGTKGAVTGSTGKTDPIFTDGEPGAGCPVAEPENTYLDQGSIPNTSGAVAAGAYALDLKDGAGAVVGSMWVQTFGAAGNHFVGLFPPRFGYFGDNGFEVLFEGMTVGGKSFQVEEVEVCYYFTTVDGANPALIEQVDGEGQVIATETVTALAVPPEGGAQPVPEGGVNCRTVVKELQAKLIRFRRPLGKFSDIGGPPSRPGMRFRGRRN